MADEKTAAKTAWDLLNEEIEKRSGLELLNLPRKRTFLWVPKRTTPEITLMTQLQQAKNAELPPDKQIKIPYDQYMADLTPMVLGRHKDWPMNDDFVIAEMFDDGEELRVYAVAKAGDNKLAFRYRIVKTCAIPVFGSEEMPYETWVDELVEEWKAIESDIDYEELATETERDAVIAYIRTLPKDYTLEDLIGDLEDENHLVEIEDENDDEDDDPEETDEPEAGDDASNGETVPAPKGAEESAAPASA